MKYPDSKASHRNSVLQSASVTASALLLATSLVACDQWPNAYKEIPGPAPAPAAAAVKAADALAMKSKTLICQASLATADGTAGGSDLAQKNGVAVEVQVAETDSNQSQLLAENSKFEIRFKSHHGVISLSSHPKANPHFTDASAEVALNAGSLQLRDRSELKMAEASCRPKAGQVSAVAGSESWTCSGDFLDAQGVDLAASQNPSLDVVTLPEDQMKITPLFWTFGHTVTFRSHQGKVSISVESRSASQTMEGRTDDSAPLGGAVEATTDFKNDELRLNSFDDSVASSIECTRKH